MIVNMCRCFIRVLILLYKGRFRYIGLLIIFCIWLMFLFKINFSNGISLLRAMLHTIKALWPLNSTFLTWHLTQIFSLNYFLILPVASDVEGCAAILRLRIDISIELSDHKFDYFVKALMRSIMKRSPAFIIRVRWVNICSFHDCLLDLRNVSTLRSDPKLFFYVVWVRGAHPGGWSENFTFSRWSWSPCCPILFSSITSVVSFR